MNRNETGFLGRKVEQKKTSNKPPKIHKVFIELPCIVKGMRLPAT